ncbi:MAG: hypothetical protein AB7J19_13360 [Beijerinckiaceae bacterium]
MSDSQTQEMERLRRSYTPQFTVTRYGKQWAIWAAASRCIVLTGTQAEMERRCRELNQEDRK